MAYGAQSTMKIVEHKNLRWRKERLKERGKKCQNLAIFIYFGDFKIIPIFVLLILKKMQAYNCSPEEGKEIRNNSISFSFVVFNQV